MPRINVVEALQHLGPQIQYALEKALHENVPDARFSPSALHRSFIKHLGNKCKEWETVPGSAIDAR
jgi:hypothetical protein